MDIIYKISKQTFWQILGKIVTSVSTFIVLGLVARNYSQDGIGTFTLVLTYLAMFYLLADFGFNAHVLRKFKVQSLDYFDFAQYKFARSERFDKSAKFKVEWQQLLGTRILWSGILLVIAVGLLPFLPFTTPSFALAVVVGSLAIIASGVYTTCNLVFQNRLSYELSVLASSLGMFVSLPAFVFLSFQKSPVFMLFLGHLFGWLVIVFTAIVLVRKIFANLRPIFDFHYSINLFKASWFIGATLALNVVYFRADSFMVAYFKSVSDAGIYNVAYSVFQSVLVLPTFIMNSYYPLMLRSVGGMRYMVVALLTLSVLGTFVFLMASPLIIQILTGGGFDGSTTALRILSLGFPAYFLSALLMWIFIKKGQYKQLLLLYTSLTLFNILANFIFIPRFSFIASSWITVLSEYVILILQIMILWLDRRKEYLKK